MVFALLVLFLTAIAFMVASRLMNAPIESEKFFGYLNPQKWQIFLLYRTQVLQIAIIVLGLAWAAFTACDDFGGFFGFWALAILASSTAIAMILIQAPIAFWITIAVVAGLAVITVLENVNGKPGDKFVNSLYILWVVLGLIIAIGDTRYFSYSKPATDLAQITVFLNIRFTLTALFLLICLIIAIVRAFRAGIPTIPSIPKLTLDSSDYFPPALAALLRPFDIVVNALVHLMWFVSDTIWKLVALFATYLARTGKNLANQLYELIFNKEIWKSIIRVLLTFFLVVGLVYGAIGVTPIVATYITTDVSYLAALKLDLAVRSLALVVMFFLSTLFGILLFFWIWDFGDQVYQALFGGSMIIVGIALAGLIMYGLGQFNYLGITGFGLLGPFTFTIIGVVGIVFLLQLARRIVTRKKARITL